MEDSPTHKLFQGMLSKFNLTGCNALITGGAGILGKQHAIALLDAGCRVILTDINTSNLQIISDSLRSDYGDSLVHNYLMDVTVEDSVSSLAEKLSSNSIQIDILVNNAALDPKVLSHGDGLLSSDRLEVFQLEDWNLQISVGLTGAFICSKIFGSLMASRGTGGVILNIASDLSVIAPDQRIYQQAGLSPDAQPVKPVTYSVIKTGLIGLTRYLATYWATQGVRCNSLSPGGVYSSQSDEFVSRVSELIPFGRMASIDEYHGAIQFLCSDASSYMTGQNVVVDGGRSIW